MQSPIEMLPLDIPSALVGQIALFTAFALIAWALLREAARVVVKVLLLVGVGLAIALWAGVLDESSVGRFLEQIGQWMFTGIKAVTEWLVEAWDQVSKR
jgi:hypothetical protein